jgi:hypothetical protein
MYNTKILLLAKDHGSKELVIGKVQTVLGIADAQGEKDSIKTRRNLGQLASENNRLSYRISSPKKCVIHRFVVKASPCNTNGSTLVTHRVCMHNSIPLATSTVGADK